MDWFFSVIRLAGASFPLASSLVQLQSELDSKAIQKRIEKLEDPISFLHVDVSEFSKKLYEIIKKEEESTVSFEEDFYKRYSRVLAVLESQGFIKGLHAIGKRFAAGIQIVDASYIMYMCALHENGEKMAQLVSRIESCEIGKWLNGKHLKDEIDLPLPVIKACFEIYESKRYGICSKGVGAVLYMGQA